MLFTCVCSFLTKNLSTEYNTSFALIKKIQNFLQTRFYLFDKRDYP